jgi:hypothetical protein
MEPPLVSYLESIDGNDLTKQDMAALAVASAELPYSFRDLGSPISPSLMVIPQDLQSFLAGHTKVSSSYLSDWPITDSENRFGEHQPFGMKSNCCPLLHGAAWGEPMYVEHLFNFIEHENKSEEERQKAGVSSLAYEHHAGERRIRLTPEEREIYGDPDVSILDMHRADVQRYPSEEEWGEAKQEQLSDNFGLFPYLFGLEWNTDENNERFVELMKELATTSDLDSPRARSIRNSMQETGITWDRALRNWRDRFTPLKAWWLRPSDRHGPTTSPTDDEATSHLTHPFIDDEEAHNYHWWEPFQYWGGVGRSSDSLDSLLQQSYPDVFNDNWLSPFLTDAVEVDGPHMLSGSHFPSMAREQPEQFNVHSPVSTGNVDFERRRANWSHASNQHHLHPSEISGQGARMTIPPQAFAISRFGRAMQGIADLGNARGGKYREEHPNSNPPYHKLHNGHYKDSDNALAMKMMQMSHQLGQTHGKGLFVPSEGSNKDANSIASGNIKQLAAAANYSLMRGKHDEGKFGSVHPSSNKIAPPIFNTGSTDAWGHDSTATLGWKWDKNMGDVAFDVKAQPFSLLQRTAHEGLVNGINMNHANHPIHSKTREIHALSPNMRGYSSLTTDLHKADDEYKPTGVFESLIEPAHVVRDLDDLATLKGFSGEWIVQKKPKGKHILVKKTGKSVDPVSLPSKVKKSLKDTVKGNATFDGYIDGDILTVVDLLVHKDTDMSLEPLSDRVNTLRTLYNTTENVHFPSPSSCVTTDDEGLMKTIASLDKTDLLIRDSYSAFLKGREVHPKWVLFVQDDISKSLPLPPLPELSIRGSDVILEYPAIFDPVIVKTDSDEDGIFVSEYDGPPHLIKQAQAQFMIWSPVAALFLKEGEGGGTFTSSSTGSLQPLHSVRKRPIKRKSVDKAPEVLTDEENDDDKHNNMSTIMRHARLAITHAEEALKEKTLISEVEGLTSNILELYAGEYGLEQTENGLWTVNEAIDDDITEKFAFPRMNRASGDGGAWSGMQADITAPTGPTEITEEENTTFGDPRSNQEEVNMDEMFRPLSMVVQTDDGEATLEVKERRAILRYPGKEKDHDERESEILPVTRDDKAL